MDQWLSNLSESSGLSWHRSLTLFRAPFLKEFPFFPVGRPRPEPFPKPSCLSSPKKSGSEVPERGGGEENYLGGVRWTRRKRYEHQYLRFGGSCDTNERQ